MEETGILEKTEQSDSCYLGLNQVSFRHGSKSLPSQVTIAGAGVEVAIASEPQRGGLGSGRVARRASTPATLSCNPLLNHALFSAWFKYGSQQFLRSRFMGAPDSAVSGTAWMRDSGAERPSSA